MKMDGNHEKQAPAVTKRSPMERARVRPALRMARATANHGATPPDVLPVCTYWATATSCPTRTYLGRGRYNESNEHSWHAYWGAPPRINFVANQSCAPHALLGHHNSLLPVTHRAVGAVKEIGLWFYFAQGCSDVAWSMGRTMLAKVPTREW